LEVELPLLLLAYLDLGSIFAVEFLHTHTQTINWRQVLHLFYAAPTTVCDFACNFAGRKSRTRRCRAGREV